MPDQNVPPALLARISTLQSEVYELKRRRLPVPPPAILMPPPFTYPGLVTDLIESPPWYPDQAGYTVTLARISARVAGATTTTVELRVSGVTRASVTLAGGAFTNTVANFAVVIPAGSPFTMRVNGLGSGLLDLAVQPT